MSYALETDNLYDLGHGRGDSDLLMVHDTHRHVSIHLSTPIFITVSELVYKIAPKTDI